LQSIDNAFGQRAGEIDRVLAEHARAVEATFGRQASHLNELLASNSIMIKQTADQVGAQSKEAIGVLTAQTHALREVSSGLLEQIHNLTQRFENQGQAILSAAKALDSSNTKIDSILESRHQAIIGLLHAVPRRGSRQRCVLCRHGREHAVNAGRAPSKSDRRSPRRPAAQQALSDRALTRRSASPHRARSATSSRRDGHTQTGRSSSRCAGSSTASRGCAIRKDRKPRPRCARRCSAGWKVCAADGAGHGSDPQGACRSAQNQAITPVLTAANPERRP
jgi:hypothetical protein